MKLRTGSKISTGATSSEARTTAGRGVEGAGLEHPAGAAGLNASGQEAALSGDVEKLRGSLKGLANQGPTGIAAQVGPWSVMPSADVDAAAERMHAAWPKNHAGPDPQGFLLEAVGLQAHKEARVAGLGAHPSQAEVAEVLDEANRIHGKPGHSKNVEGIARALLADDVFVGGAGLPADQISDVSDAARWLNLADLRVPVAVLAAHRKLSDAEFGRWVKTRPDRAAETAQDLGVVSEEVAELMRTHRDPGDRSTAQILVDMIDQAAALAAKPFCRSGDGVNRPKLVEVLDENAAKAGVSETIRAAFRGAIERGLVDDGLAQAREQDLFIR